MAKVKTEQDNRGNGGAPVSLTYIGPTLAKYGVRQYTTFLGGEPKAFEVLKQEVPDIARLLVPLSVLTQKRRELADRTSAVSAAYRKVLSFIA